MVGDRSGLPIRTDVDILATEVGVTRADCSDEVIDRVAGNPRARSYQFFCNDVPESASADAQLGHDSGSRHQ